VTTNIQRSVERDIKREQARQKAALTLAPTLASKLVSIVVHAEEMMSADGHPFDRIALAELLTDREVQTWTKALAILAPMKRK